MVLDKSNSNLFMFGVPRDLYYHGAKINTLYRKYGPKTLAEAVGRITGIEVDNYAVIELYAFIDLVDILGGLDVELSETLSDPSYRVRNDDGSWSTLYYPAGKHHLDGKSALRVARARHFTPIYSRDERQQKILLAMKDKLCEIGLKDIGNAGRIIRLSMKYVDTDLSVVDALSLYGKVRKIKSYENYVISSLNVLYASHSDKGAWILLPIDNNWNLIKKFVYEKIFS